MNTLYRATSNLLVLFTVLFAAVALGCFVQNDYPLFSWMSALSVCSAVWAKFMHLRYQSFVEYLNSKEEEKLS